MTVCRCLTQDKIQAVILSVLYHTDVVRVAKKTIRANIKLIILEYLI